VTSTENPTTNGHPRAGEGPGNVAAARAALDVMLTDAAVSQCRASRFLDPVATAKLTGALARRPPALARRLGGLGAELARVAAGSSELAPAKSDRRFSDRAWNESWMFRRLMQAYLGLSGTVDGLIDDADLEWQADRQVRFTLGNVLDAIAPTNFPLTNPSVLKETIDRGGANLVRGSRRLVRDVSKGRLPAMVDTSKFEVGGNLALTTGSVVLRTDVFELIHYAPQTAEVYETPLLIVPPTINKYYVLDLAPGRSLVEYLLGQGHQVFMVSWRNPERENGHFDFDTYADATLEAGRAAADIAGHESVNVMAACSGGMIAAGALGHLAADGRLGSASSLTLMVCAIDNTRAGTASALATKEMAATAVAQSARTGYLTSEALGSVFAWLRPNDLIWNYVVNNYWLGREPPAFDILYWNQDGVRLAAGLHRDFVKLAMQNALATPDAFTVLGTPVDLGQVSVDSYIVAGASDHIVPWRNAYASTQLLGGETRFVLSASGHIQALINPPPPDGAESRASYQVGDEYPADPDEWSQQAVSKRGSWWPDYIEWLSTRSGGQKHAPKTLGNRRYKAQAKAPGTYVHAA
jgi:polyhydroxyalkanoate synthase subunit PhaC